MYHLLPIMDEMRRQMMSQLCSCCPDHLVCVSFHCSRVTMVLYSPGVTAGGLPTHDRGGDPYSPRWASGGMMYILIIDGTLKR